MEILLGFFGVEACYLQHQSILAMYSYCAVSGIVGRYIAAGPTFSLVYTVVVIGKSLQKWYNVLLFFPLVDIGDHIDVIPVVEGMYDSFYLQKNLQRPSNLILRTLQKLWADKHG